MFRNPRISGRIVAVATVGLLALGFANSGASAGNWPDANANERDHVTGFLCTTPSCDVLRLPRSNCICKKENPTEENLSRLRLTCYTSVGFRWEACPVRPPFGN